MSLKTLRYIAGTAPLPSVGAFPAQTTKTGTISSLLTVVTGVGTLFAKELVQSDYIYNATTNEIRKIVGISSDTILRIDSPFTSELAGQAVFISRAKYVSVAITATGSGTKDGAVVATGQFISLNSDGGVAPFAYSGSLIFDVGYFE